MDSGTTGGPPPIDALRDGRSGTEYVPQRRKGGGGESSERDGGGSGSAGGGAHADDEATAVTIAGLSADKLTPETERVIETLLADLGRMRTELEIARRRLVEIEQVVDHHPFLPVFSREAFRRQIAHVLAHTDRSAQPSGLLIVTLLNGDAIRRDFGLAVRDQALRHLCETVRAALRPNDILGSLTGNDLAILTLIEEAGAMQTRAGALAGLTAERPFLSGERRIDLAVGCGAAVLTQTMTVENAVAAADADLIASLR